MTLEEKARMRKALRASRREHVAAIEPRVKALLFLRPPAPLLSAVPQGATIGLYHAGPDEAPAASYARFFQQAGHTIALPWFAGRDEPMEFRRWSCPHLDELVERGPYGVAQPLGDADAVVPDVVFVPLIGFTSEGARLGQGGGHYDRWLEAHPTAIAIGMAWDCQLVDELPHEAHDRPLAAVVTPTRLYGPF